jgi:hypothetical protein
MGNKDTIMKKQDEQIQEKIKDLTEKQSQIRELNIDKQKQENELLEMKNFNEALKKKLEESLKSLESNANMISWLNKQLNEKQSSTTSGLYSNFGGATKPPTPSITSGSQFKPSFSGIEQMGSNKLQ